MKSIPALILTATVANAEMLKHADLAKLQDPTLRNAEVSRLAGCGKGKEILTGYHLLTANQPEGKASLRVLCASSEYPFFRDLTIYGGYRIEKPEELFGEVANPVVSRLEPSLDPVSDSVILIFNSEGDEIRPFGGDNYTNHGYYFDFDRDGVLDRADSTHYSVKEAPKTSVEVFSLKSIEPKPRTLLEVVFNWHPNSAPDANDWKFTCFDDDRDGIPEIGFGPEDATTPKNQRQIVFRLDPVTQRYSAGELPAQAHLRVMMPGETLASIAKSGGLGYPLVKDPDDSPSDEPPAPSPQAPYVFRSLKGRTASDLATFFQGKPRHDSFDGPEDAFPNRLPENFRDLAPKRAAIALAEANRTPTHRAKWKMALDDRGGLTPPESGWLLHDWGSSSCYSYSSHLFALRFGVPDPRLIVFEYNSIGVVGRNPWADQPAHNVRVIQLTDGEARFLADTVFWLDRIRTFSDRKSEFGGFGGSSTADGFATVSLYPDGAAPRELASGTVWATSSISGNWEGAYNKDCCVNLAEFLIADYFPAMLGERWNVAPEIGRHSLMTPTGQRLAERVDEDGRQKLSDAFAGILRKHSKDPIPAAALAKLVNSAADEALSEFLAEFQSLLAAIPAHDVEDQEFEALEKRFDTGHFGNPLEQGAKDDRKGRARLSELREIRRFKASAILRDPLTSAITRLRLAGTAAGLISAIIANDSDSRWALNLLRRLDPNTWAEVVAGQFANAEVDARRTILETLAAGSPSSAKTLIDGLTASERVELAIEIARFHREHDAAAFKDDLSGLMEIVRSRNADIYRRGAAIGLLAEGDLTAGMREEFTKLLVAEIRDPQKGKYDSSSLSDAIAALSSLPDTANHLDLIASTPDIVHDAYQEGLRAVAAWTVDRPDREKLIAAYIRPKFLKSKGMMNEVFLDVLTYDLRELAPEIAAFATEGPSVPDGDGGNYSGGGFKTPVGQRYHLAREITALWSEMDGATLGRMWIHFVVNHPSEFAPGSEIARLAEDRIRSLPSGPRSEEIAAAAGIRPFPEYAAATGQWLKGLGQD